MAFEDSTRSFPIVWASTSRSLAGLYYAMGSRLDYPNALASPFGTSCAGTLAGWNNLRSFDLPYAGSEFYRLELTGGIPAAPTYLLAGFDTSLHVQLSPGCTFRVGPVPIVVSAGTADAAGDYLVPIGLPDAPLVIGDLHWQTIQLAPGGVLKVSNGFTTGIR